MVENDIEQKAMHRQAAGVLDKSQLAELDHKNLTRDHVVPIISPSVS